MAISKKLFDASVREGLKKIAVSIYDPDQYSKLQQYQSYGSSLPTFGMMAGGGVAGSLAPKIWDTKLPLAGKMGTVAALGGILGAGGLMLGTIARQARKEKFIKSLPDDDPFKIAFNEEKRRLAVSGLKI
jgi:hypothetical protein